VRIILAAVTGLYLSAAGSGQAIPSPAPNQPTEVPQITGPGISGLPTFESLKPKITLQNALELAEGYIKKEKVKTSSHYLSEARINLDGGRLDVKALRWLFVWTHNSGLSTLKILLTVSMSGKVSELPDPFKRAP
jgi:hypothetical protein